LAGCDGAWTCCSSTAPTQIFRINLKFSPSRQERQHCYRDSARHRPSPGSSGARRAQRGAAALPFVAKTIRRPPRRAQSAASAPPRPTGARHRPAPGSSGASRAKRGAAGGRPLCANDPSPAAPRPICRRGAAAP
jgi:hypothetical protein